MSNIKERQKKRLLKELEKNPFINVACARTGVPRSSVYRWRKEDRYFHKAILTAQERGYEASCEMTEAQIIKKIQEGHFPAMRYWLENNSERYRKKKDEEMEEEKGGWGELLALAMDTMREEGLDPETGQPLNTND